MTRAGKEPAEDAKRAIRRAIELAALQVKEMRMFKLPESQVRFVTGTATPDGWPHKLPAVEVRATVGFDGSIDRVTVHCGASDGDPMAELWIAPRVQQCDCDLEDLPRTLKEVWVARREVMAKFKAGVKGPIFDGKWKWAVIE